MANSHGVIVPRAIDDLKEYPNELVLEELQAQFAESNESQKLALACALAKFGSVEIDFLVDSIGDAPTVEADNIAVALAKSKEDSLVALRQAAEISETKANWVLKHRWRSWHCTLETAPLRATCARFDLVKLNF